MNRRYDFDYWPPLPLEQEPTWPIYESFDYELCNDMALAEDPEIHQALYASGEWLDIQDFWLEAKPPKSNDLISDPELCNLTGHGEQTQRVLSKRHLGHATHVFRLLAYDLIELAHIAESPGQAPDADPEESTNWQLLTECIFNKHDPSCSQEQLLIRKEFVTDLYENKDFLPWNLGEESHLLIAKVALKWTVDIDAFGSGLIDLKKPR